MRLVGETNDVRHAEKFVGFLASQGIEAQVRDVNVTTFGVWVLDEDRLPECSLYFQRFLSNPNASEFNVVAPPPKVASTQRVTMPRKSFGTLGQVDFSRLPVTFSVIGLCIVLALLAFLPGLQWLRGHLFFSEELGRQFPEIREGQVWRLVTPVFLHGNVLHLLFNMLWMYQLGGEIEAEEGSLFLGLFLLMAAIVCDVSQYLVSGPAFVGLSGVVYAFLSYIWIMSRRSLTTQYAMNDQTLIVMVVWLLICLVGIIPSVANTQHVIGLLFGLAWGWMRSQAPKRRIRSKN